MAEVTLHIGGYSYDLSCADGEEEALMRAGEIVARRVATARATLGGLTETRQLLFAAILLADELPATTASDAHDQVARAVNAAAERIEQIAGTLDALLTGPAATP
jgi:cell division protein ZapA